MPAYTLENDIFYVWSCLKNKREVGEREREKKEKK